MKTINALSRVFIKKNILSFFVIFSPVLIINLFGVAPKRAIALYAVCGIGLLIWAVSSARLGNKIMITTGILNPIWLILAGVLVFTYTYPEPLYRQLAFLGLFFIAYKIAALSGKVIFLYVFPLINWLQLSFLFFDTNSLWLILAAFSIFVIGNHSDKFNVKVYEDFSIFWNYLFIFAIGGLIPCISNLYREIDRNLWLSYIDVCVLPFFVLYLAAKIIRSGRQAFRLLLFIVFVSSSICLLPEFLPYKMALSEIPRFALDSSRLAIAKVYEFFSYNLYITATFIAYYISILLVIPLTLSISTHVTLRLKIISILIGLYSSGILIKTGGRMGLIALALSFLVIFATGKFLKIVKIRYCLLLVFILAVSFYFLKTINLFEGEIKDRYNSLLELRDDDMSVSERVDCWKEGLQEITRYPMGRGFNPSLEVTGRAMHNDYIYTILGSGWIGFVGFIGLIVSLYLKSISLLLSKNSTIKICGLIMLGILISFCINALSDHLMTNYWGYNIFFLTIAVLLAAGLSESIYDKSIGTA
jgi:O-antigen ligase